MKNLPGTIWVVISVLFAVLSIGVTADAAPAEQGLVTLPSSERVQVDVRILDANGNPRSTFNVGDSLQIAVDTSAQNAQRVFLNLVEIDANGACTLVFPNAFSSNPEVATGRFVVPDNNSYRLRVTPPEGTDIVQAFASTEPFDLRDVFNTSTSQQTPFASLCTDPNNFAQEASVAAQGLSVEGNIATAFTSFTVGTQPANRNPIAQFSFTPFRPGVNEIVSFDASASQDPDGQIQRYEWDFNGDGRTDVLGQQARVRFNQAGQAKVTLTVTDIRGARSSVTRTITVGQGNRQPTASFAVDPPQPQPGQTVIFDGTGSTDPDGRIVQWRWTFEEGNRRLSLQGSRVSVRFTNAGTVNVTLTVTDDSGTTASTSRSITVGRQNQAPTARFNVSPPQPKVNQTVTLDASASSDPDGQIQRYEWDFNSDGQVDAVGPVVQTSFNRASSFTVTLTVADDGGSEVSSSQTINVLPINRTPVAQFTTNPVDPGIDETVTFDASNSFDPDGQIGRYEWRFGDGSSGVGRTTTHRYRTSGPVTVTLTVVDDRGRSASTSQQLRVRARSNQAPNVNFRITPSNPSVDELVTFDASNSFDPDGQIGRYEWRFGDNSVATGRTVTHQYRSSGSFTVQLRVVDDQGASSLISQSVFVQSRPNQTPVASFNVSTATPEAGEPVTFSSNSFDPDGTISRIQWRFGDGSGSQGQRVQHAYSRSGTFTATMTVTDDRGASASMSRQIEVGSTLPSGPGFFVEALDDTRLRIVIQGRSSWQGNRPFSLQLEADDRFTGIEQRTGGAVPQGLQPQPVNQSRLERTGTVGATPVQFIVEVSANTSKIKFDLRLDVDGNGQPERNKGFVSLGSQLKQAPSNPFVINFEPGNLAPLSQTRVCLVLVDQPGFQFTLCFPYSQL